MAESLLIKADEIAQELGVSKQYAYKLVQKLNDELKKNGFITIAGRVSTQYYREKIYGYQPEKEKGE